MGEVDPKESYMSMFEEKLASNIQVESSST